MSRIEEEMGEQDGESEEDGEDGDRKGRNTGTYSSSNKYMSPYKYWNVPILTFK